MENNDVTKWSGYIKRVAPEEIDDLTRAGWKVLGVFQDDVLRMASDVEVNPNPAGPNDYNYTSTVYTQRHHRCRETWFLVGLDEESTIARQSEQIASLQKSLDESRSAQAEMSGQLEAARKGLEATNLRLQETSQRLEETRQDLSQERQGRRKVETDLGKVRQAVGDLRWREILEG